MDKNFKKYEIIVSVFFIYSCIVPFIGWWFSLIFSSLYIVIFTSKAIWCLNFSKIKMALLIIAQLICCIILYAIWIVIWFFIFTDGINL